MLALEFNDENGNPSKEVADKVAARCLENKMLVLTCGSYGQVIRLIPALNISDGDAQKALEIIEKSVSNLK
jgi:4-aminobutyrate aminotransferase-like enzyme